MNPLNGGLFHATAWRNPTARMLVPGSGMTKPSKRTFKAPAHLTPHSAPRGRPEEECTATRRPLGNGAGATPRGRYPPIGGTACSERPYASAIGARLVSFVVRRRRQWPVVHALRTAIRVTTAVSSLLKLRLLVGEILTNSEEHYSTPAKSLNCTLFPKFG